MSDYLPFVIQVEIMKRLPVKSLIQFRSVSKAWKSLIDSSDFIASYTCYQNQQHILVKYNDEDDNDEKILSIVDDDEFTRLPLTPPHLDDYSKLIGCSDGLLCFYACRATIFLWNPSIRRGFHVDVPIVENGYLRDIVLGFGVCRETNDLKIVKITYVATTVICDRESDDVNVEVWTLSTRAWRSLHTNLPRNSLAFNCEDYTGCLIAIDGVVYWLARDTLVFEYMIISFDVTSEEFGEVKLPDSLAHTKHFLTMSKLWESLVVLENVQERNSMVYNLWMMEDDDSKSFTNISTFEVDTPYEALVMIFRQAGEPVIRLSSGQLVVYDYESTEMDHLGFDGVGDVSFVQPYTETLFLHDQPNLTVDTEAVHV